jgi:hypothetical protein
MAPHSNTQSSTEQSLETLQDIKRMMERSSRFISLSGLSGVSAGVCAIVGAFIGHNWIRQYVAAMQGEAFPAEARDLFEIKMLGLAVAVVIAALLTSTWFTWRKARKSQLPIWDHASKKLAINMAIPLAAGGFFAFGLLQHGGWNFIAPACLVFYGLALVNASKYTLTDIRYLGFLEIALGCINMYFPHEGLYFWTTGFGLLHIIYGLIMWWKYERS